MSSSHYLLSTSHISHKHHYIILSSTALFFLLLDQLTKFLAFNGSLYLRGSFFQILPTTNTGSLFSLLADASYSNILFIILSLVALTVLFFFGTSLGQSKYVSFLLGLLSAGILGNLFDRIMFGAVLDWISIGIWPIFNIADACIVSGVLLSVLHLWPKKKKS